MKGVRVLGVDPGTRVAGYGVLDIGAGRTPRLVGCGAIRLPGPTIPERLRVLYEDLLRVIVAHRPAVIAVETVFHGKSFHSVVKVGEARGVVLLAGALNGLEVHQFTPAMVKKTATGNGRASKHQVQRMIGRLLGLDRDPEPRDVTDALAIAYCYGQRSWRQGLERRSVDWKALARKAREERPGRAARPRKRDDPETGNSGAGEGTVR